MKTDNRQSAFMPDGTLTSVTIKSKHKPQLTNQYPLFGIGTPLVDSTFVREHMYDTVPNEIQVTIPGASYTIKGNAEAVSHALKHVTK